MTRIIVWTIVGILVVAGVIFFVSTRKQSNSNMQQIKMTDQAYERVTATYQNRVDRLKDIISKIKDKYQNPSGEIQSLIDDLDTKINALEAAVADLPSKTDLDARLAATKNIRAIYNDAVKTIKAIGGTVNPGPDTTGH
jgi:peptidoglycan hydrolase CwlO-like protein